MSPHLNAKEVLAGVSPEQGPLGGLPLQQVEAHGHLAARDVGPQALEDAAEGQVAHGRQGRHVHLKPRGGEEEEGEGKRDWYSGSSLLCEKGDGEEHAGR